MSTGVGQGAGEAAGLGLRLLRCKRAGGTGRRVCASYIPGPERKPRSPQLIMPCLQQISAKHWQSAHSLSRAGSYGR